MRIIFTLSLIVLTVACRSDQELGQVVDDVDQDGSPAGEDCNDSDPTIHPDATELCDGRDDNCDGLVDEGLLTEQYDDADGDGFGDHGTAHEACPSDDTVANGDDCNDADAGINPDASETCDGVDEDCDGQIDNGTTPVTWYADTDGDGYGDDDAATEACTPPAGYVADGGDCNDADPGVNPGAEEVCDSDDENCDEQIDEGFDLDGDGTARCCDPGDYVLYYPQSGKAPITQIAGRLRPADNGGVWGPETTILSGTDIRVVSYANVLSGMHTETDIVWTDVTESPTQLYTTTCVDGEWQTLEHGERKGGQRGWGDTNGDGHLDYIDYDWGCCNLGKTGTGDGTTYLGDGTGGFSAYSGASWDVRYTKNQWTGSAVWSLDDFDGDGHADLIFWTVASGGSSTSSVWYQPGDGAGNFGEEVALGSFGAAGGHGDMGDIDGDGCVDWVSGANDDSSSPGLIRAILGDCAGGKKAERNLANQASYAASISSGIYGDGQARLHDADDDGDLDLFTTYNISSTSGRGPVLYWENDGAGNFPSAPTEALVPVSANKYYNHAFVPIGR